MFISRHTLKWTKTCRSSGDFPHAHTAHFLLNRHTGNAPVHQAGQQAHVRPLAADAHVRQVTDQAGARLAAVELAAEDVREPGLVGPRPVRFGPSARVRARMPRSRMTLPTRLPDAVTPLRSSAALIFPAPQRSWPSHRTARTPPAIGSTRSASGCSIIQ